MATTVVTRDQLHRLVWAGPLAEAAAQLGISTKALETLCETLDVPYPYSGYWGSGAPRSAAPHKLRNAKPGTPQSIEIGLPDPPPQTPPARRRAKTTSPPEPKRQEPAPQIASRSLRTHRIITARQEEDRRRRELWKGLGGFRPDPHEAEIDRRRQRFENLLFNAIEKRGHKVETLNGSLHQISLQVAGQSITYIIRERYTLTRRALTEEELREPGNIHMGRASTQVRTMTGELIFSASTSSTWPRDIWRDKPESPLELQIEAIVLGLEDLADRATAQQALRREEERLYQEEQQRREEARRERRRDANRWRRFRELAARADEAERVRSFILKLRQSALATGGAGPDIGQWLDWAEAQVRSWDPICNGVDAVVREIEAVSADDYLAENRR